MKKKYLFFDIDGTLMNGYGIIEDSTRHSLGKLKELGHEIFLATGRGYFDIPQTIFDMGFHGMILSDGAYVEYDKEVIAHNTMDIQEVKCLTSALEEDGGHLLYFGMDSGFINEKSSEPFSKWLEILLSYSPLWEESITSTKIIKSIDDLKGQHVEKIVYIDWNGDVERLKEKFGHYFMILPSNLADRSDTSKGEITRLGINKAYGINKMLNHLGATKDDVIAFGDGLNDIDMIQLADKGVAMGNGAPQLKKYADLVTTDIGNDGIYNGLTELGII
jgi:Cof subfamily protein (haloacid dehalogenase superfamily)